MRLSRMMPAPGERHRLEMGRDIMRSDMHKVIVERPRMLRSRWTNKKTALRVRSADVLERGDDYDSGPKRASSARHEKRLNENLAPLQRYLARQVGRPWNKVYSEICRTIDTRSAIGMHVLQHLGDLVTIDVFIADGVLLGRRYCDVRPVSGLYVHPVTGLLRTTIARERKHRSVTIREDPNLIHVSDILQYEKINGLWFRMEYRKANAADSGEPQNPWTLVRKQQCDRNTIGKIEKGERGILTYRQTIYDNRSK